MKNVCDVVERWDSALFTKTVPVFEPDGTVGLRLNLRLVAGEMAARRVTENPAWRGPTPQRPGGLRIRMQPSLLLLLMLLVVMVVVVVMMMVVVVVYSIHFSFDSFSML